jgi:hypothetical protein
VQTTTLPIDGSNPGLETYTQWLANKDQGPELAHFQVVLKNNIRPVKAGDQLAGSRTTKDAISAVPIDRGLAGRLCDKANIVA